MLPWLLTLILLVAALYVGRKLLQTREQLSDLKLESDSVQRDLRAQIERAERLREGLMEATDDLLLILDGKKQIIAANSAARQKLGHHHLIGETLIGALRQPDLEVLLEDAHLVRGETVERRIEFDHQLFHAQARVLSDGEHTVEVLALRDVTEFQRLERARREMVSNVSHELSTPILAIGLLADTLNTSVTKDKPKRIRKMASDIRREVDTLTQLVQEMRDLSLIESGQMPVRMVPTDLNAIVQPSVEAMRPLAENKGQSITVSVPEGIRVLADDVQIQRAIKNILHNAVKFTPEGGRIDISATADQDEAVIAVKDNGPGIPAVDLPRVFERFFQVDRARHGGTGLGLAIVRHIVLAHGGRTWVESIEGQGATFYIALALAEPLPQVPPVPDSSPAEQASGDVKEA